MPLLTELGKSLGGECCKYAAHTVLPAAKPVADFAKDAGNVKTRSLGRNSTAREVPRLVPLNRSSRRKEALI
jgi:hypothetical protein